MHNASAAAILTIDLGALADNWRLLAERVRPARCGAVVPLVGRVSMDTVTVDVTDVPAHRLQPGALFDLIDAVQDINALALQAGTNGYEIPTSLGPRYRRQYIEIQA